MLFNDEPINVEDVTAPAPKSMVPQASMQNTTTNLMNNVANQQQQISSSGNQVLGSSEARDDCIINGENIGQEPDDTFKIDEQ